MSPENFNFSKEHSFFNSPESSVQDAINELLSAKMMLQVAELGDNAVEVAKEKIRANQLLAFVDYLKERKGENYPNDYFAGYETEIKFFNETIQYINACEWSTSKEVYEKIQQAIATIRSGTKD